MLAMFVSGVEHDLHSHADTQNWTTACEAALDDAWTVHGLQPVHDSGEGTHAWHNESIRIHR
jgi:hypothetical protein